MKYPKIVSLTLANGVGFLVFATILAGCQKSAVHKSGLFTAIAEKQKVRKPASFHRTFENFQDTRQIFIFCQLNDLDPKKCYQRQLNQSLREFAGQTRIPASDVEEYRKSHSYEKAAQKTESVLSKVLEDLEPGLNKLVQKRVSFCVGNASFYMERCLKQYLKKETFQALNEYQNKANVMNGHEYLYLKKKIEKKLVEKLNGALTRIQAEKEEEAKA